MVIALCISVRPGTAAYQAYDTPPYPLLAGVFVHDFYLRPTCRASAAFSWAGFQIHGIQPMLCSTYDSPITDSNPTIDIATTNSILVCGRIA